MGDEGWEGKEGKGKGRGHSLVTNHPERPCLRSPNGGGGGGGGLGKSKYMVMIMRKEKK